MKVSPGSKQCECRKDSHVPRNRLGKRFVMQRCYIRKEPVCSSCPDPPIEAREHENTLIHSKNRPKGTPRILANTPPSCPVCRSTEEKACKETEDENLEPCELILSCPVPEDFVQRTEESSEDFQGPFPWFFKFILSGPETSNTLFNRNMYPWAD